MEKEKALQEVRLQEQEEGREAQDRPLGPQAPSPGPPGGVAPSPVRGSPLSVPTPTGLPPLGERAFASTPPHFSPAERIARLPFPGPSAREVALTPFGFSTALPQVRPVAPARSSLSLPTMAKPSLAPREYSASIPAGGVGPKGAPRLDPPPVSAPSLQARGQWNATLPWVSAAGTAGTAQTAGEQRTQVQTQTQPEGEEGGGGAGAVSLLELLWEVVGDWDALQGLAEGDASYLLLIDRATQEDGVRLLLYLLQELYRCRKEGRPPIQWPAGIPSDLLRLAGGRITYLPNPPGEDTLLPKLQEMLGAGSVAIIPEESEPANLADLQGVMVVRFRSRPNRPPLGVLDRVFGGAAPRPPVSPPKELEEVLGAVPPSLDRAAAERWREYHARLAGVVRKVPTSWRRASPAGKSPEGKESNEHYWVKLYVAWLYRGMAEKVRVEEPWQNANIVPDVAVDGGPVYEIETLYGTGDPLTKLNDTVDKYDKYGGREVEVRIVIPNPQALLFLPDLLAFQRERRSRGRQVSLWTLRLADENAREDGGLEPLEAVARHLDRFRGGSAPSVGGPV
ncbi:hypothetical protein HRbin23_00267 [bacterium HR23]|nr:hypothetical protein HRbin23_00267 [bacterium HR23]